MRVTQRVTKILSSYEGDNPGTKSALARILMEGKLGGSGRALILPIDHAFNKTLVPKFSGTDPEYHFQLAIDAGLSALAAPLDMLGNVTDTFAGSLPLILQLQAGEPFNASPQQIHGSVRDALRLGCVGISCAVTNPDREDNAHVVALVEEAKSYGLAVMMWVSATTEAGEYDTSVEAIARVGHKAGELGAHLICVRVPGSDGASGTVTAPLSDRIRKVSRANGLRMTRFASSFMQEDSALFEELHGVRDGGAQGYVLPPNSLYRPYDQALNILDKSLNIYLSKE
jgi:class I fructose-bisphosphate aldolase